MASRIAARSVTQPAMTVSSLREQLVLLRDYEKQILPTDQLPLEELRPVQFGLFGEVGSVMATIKKLHREDKAYSGYRTAVIEELGDVLWYFATLCRRFESSLEKVFARAITEERPGHVMSARDASAVPYSRIPSAAYLTSLDDTLVNLGEATSALLSTSGEGDDTESVLRAFADVYLLVIQSCAVPLPEILRTNSEKVRGRFLEPDPAALPKFDSRFPQEERLPSKFEIVFTQRKNGQCYLQWNGVFIGDPLTDNIGENDSYRFHDVFHLAHAAILHWSPVFRALIKQKRKSESAYDRDQDGGRAIVVEEGLTAWVFSHAKDMEYFRDQKRVSFDLLKGIQEFVRGYEVEACPLKLWETAILEGYLVFRQLRENNGGVVIGDRHARTIAYRRLDRN